MSEGNNQLITATINHSSPQGHQPPCVVVCHLVNADYGQSIMFLEHNAPSSSFLYPSY